MNKKNKEWLKNCGKDNQEVNNLRACPEGTAAFKESPNAVIIF